MKTQIITIFAVLVVALGVTNSTYAATAKNADNSYTVLTDISAINKIEVHGNVELYISDGATDQVKVYNKYYSESALVQSKNGVLRISSYKTDKLVVWVTANDLRSISAFDNAEIKSFGDISKIEFDVDLHNNASAKLNLDAFSASVTVNDDAKANLSGTVNEYALKYNHEENVNHKDLVAAHTSKKQTLKVVAAKEFDLADL
ncbi:GIN domain-containing protein [Mucilaginibacter sp. OK098]|uniref:GIN domain-containing protein n=1 Tax=Mucilaginibacter sp. OK098 TaxID=1855297 RepID=UPI000910F1BE|nr:DUF2807 domain-containing protein [Mucilaginibacter sp. OK098]SHN28598.1 hypothetical protein SAMN05216524_108173 [Mucilaginibacter sp. OK098]